jgi:CBS domain containing-hemolysin-like protein
MGRLLQGWWRRPRPSDSASHTPLSSNPLPPAADQVEVDLVDQAEAFQSLRVSDVMTPRADIVALEISTPLAEVVRAFVDSEHSRMPVYRDTLDDPVGVVHIKDMLKLLAPADVAPESAPQPLWRDPILHRLRREVLYVPASMRTADLLLRMRVQRIHMALVIDEFGGTDGLVTLEDLIEAVVGEISDEHDEASTPEIVRRAGGLLEADARAPLDELEALLGLTLSPPDQEEEIDTVAGLVATLAGRVPQRGEVIVHPAGFEFEVMEADPRRIRRLRIRPRAPLIDGVAAPEREVELDTESPADAPAVANGPVKSVFLPDDRLAGQD